MSNIDLRKQARKMAKASFFGRFELDGKDDFIKGLRKLDFKLLEFVAKGSHVKIFKVDGLGEIYGRKNLCLKVFINSRTLWGSNSHEGRSPIIDATKIQNLLAIKGLAPRVYDLVEVEGKTAQVTDYLEGKQEVVTIKDGRFLFNEAELKKGYNFIAGKLVDFQASSFVGYENCRRKLLDEACNVTQFPQGGGGIYTSLPYLSGKRNTKTRLERFKFTDFQGKTVLDIGGNIGVFMREAHKLGAKRVVGFDLPHICKIGAELAILDGYFNLDFIGADIKSLTGPEVQKLTGIERFDIHLFLAMENWVGYPDWIKNCDTLYYEGHGVDRPFEVRNYKKGDK